MNFEILVIFGSLFFILILWIYYILRNRSCVTPNQKILIEYIEKLKEDSIQNGIINREKLGNLIQNAIVTGVLTP